MKLTKKTAISIVLGLMLVGMLAVSVFAYLDRANGTVSGYYCEGLLYNGLNGGYHANTYVNTSGNNVDTIWAKVQLVVNGGHPSQERYGSSNEVDTPECTSSSNIFSVRGYHYIELTNGNSWGSYATSSTLYLVPPPINAVGK